MKIYIDTCCYGRPYDDMTIPNNKAQAEAVFSVVEMCKIAGITIYGSTATVDEINDIDDKKRETRELVQAFHDDTITDFLPATADIVLRARDFMTQGMGEYDSYHLSFAEAAGVVFLLTTDRKFIRRAARFGSAVNVIDPINFIQEVQKWAQ